MSNPGKGAGAWGAFPVQTRSECTGIGMSEGQWLFEATDDYLLKPCGAEKRPQLR